MNFGFDNDFDGFFGKGKKGKKQGGLFPSFGLGIFGGDMFGDDSFFGGRKNLRKNFEEKSKEKKSEKEDKEDKEIEKINGNKFGGYSKFLNQKTKKTLKMR